MADEPTARGRAGLPSPRALFALAALIRDRLGSGVAGGLAGGLTSGVAGGLASGLTGIGTTARAGLAALDPVRTVRRRGDAGRDSSGSHSPGHHPAGTALLHPSEAARAAVTEIVTAAAPFAATSYARARLLRQLHASGLLSRQEADDAALLLDSAG